jgi:hypothetical protein
VEVEVETMLELNEAMPKTEKKYINKGELQITEGKVASVI